MDKYFTDNEYKVVSSNRILYTATPFARSALLHLQEIGELEAKMEHTSSRANLSSFLFFVVILGNGTLIYEGKEYELNVGDCVFINCQKPYSHTTSEQLWTIKWVHFYGPSFSLVYEKYTERGGSPLFRPESISPFLDLHQSLFDIASGSDYMRDMLINEELARLQRLKLRNTWI